MNEALAFGLYRDAGVPAPRVGYARVFVTVPGIHDHRDFGLYSLVENIDKDFLRGVVKAPGGALFKPVSGNLFADLGDKWASYRQTYDPKDEPDPAQQRRLIEFCQFVARSTDADFASRLGSYVDLDELARYMAVTTWLADIDGLLGPGQNFYLYLHPTTGKFLFLPWDQDHSFGQFPMRGTQEEREQLSIRQPVGRLEPVPRAPLRGRRGFRERYLARLTEFAANQFQPERFDAQITALARRDPPRGPAGVGSQAPPVRRGHRGGTRARGGNRATGQLRPTPRAVGPGPRLRPAADGVRSRATGGAFPRTDPGKHHVQATQRRLQPRRIPGGSVPPRVGYRPTTARSPTRSNPRASPTGSPPGTTSHSGRLTDAQLRAGLDKDLGFVRGGPPPAGPEASKSPQPRPSELD